MEVLGIDVGGSGIKGAIVDTKKGELTTERHRIPTPESLKPEPMADTVKALVKYFKWKGPIGSTFPSSIQHGIITVTTNLHQSWVGVNVPELFEKKTGCPALVLNDGDAAGVAEMQYGAGKGRKGVVMLITIGTGLGTAVFVNGELLPNTELGHIILNDMVAEQYASDAARKRDELKRKEWAERFNEYLLRLEFLLRPDLFILGGGASKKFDKYQKKFTTHAEVVPAKLLNHAGIIGAAGAAAKAGL